MRIIIITSPAEVSDEAAAISSLIHSGEVERVHIRKPYWDEQATRRLIARIPAECYPFLTLHDHHRLAMEYGLGGVHLNSRNPNIPIRRDVTPPTPTPSQEATGKHTLSVSRSCHSADDVRDALAREKLDYCFFSPIFDSVSKSGYRGRITPTDCNTLQNEGILDHRVYALSGVTPENLQRVKVLGFSAAAILGAAWQHRDIALFINRLKSYRR